MKFLLDDNVPYSLKTFLLDKGIECIKTFEAGLKGKNDEEIIKYAISNNYKIITLDLDFGFLFSKYPKATIIIVRPRILLPERIIEIVVKWLDKIMCGERINYIDRRQNKDQKIRIAPLSPLRMLKINFSTMRMSF